MTYDQYCRIRDELQASWASSDKRNDGRGVAAALAVMWALAENYPDHAARWSRDLHAAPSRTPTVRR